MGLAGSHVSYLAKRVHAVAFNKAPYLKGLNRFAGNLNKKFRAEIPRRTPVYNTRSLALACDLYQNKVVYLLGGADTGIFIPAIISRALKDKDIHELIINLQLDIKYDVGFPDLTVKAALITSIRHLVLNGVPEDARQKKFDISDGLIKPTVFKEIGSLAKDIGLSIFNDDPQSVRADIHLR